MSWHARVFGALGLLGLALAQPASAQDRGVGIAVRGGGFNGLASLNESGADDFKRVGYNVGGAVTFDVHRYVSLRGDFTYARNELRHNEVKTGVELDRFFYDAALQLQYPSPTGWMPYVNAGLGGVTLHPVGGSEPDKTKLAGTAALGLGYTIPGSSVGLFAETQGWLYDFSELDGAFASFDHNQFDLTWSAGFSYRIPYTGGGRAR